MRAIGEESRVGDSLRNRREAVERLLEIRSLVMLEGLPNHPPPVRSGRKLVGTEIDDGRVVERPVNGVPGTRHDSQHRPLPRLGDRRLPAGEREISRRVLGEDSSLEYRQERPVGLDADEELRAPDPGDREGRLHLQAAGTAAEEMGGAPEQVDHPRSLFLDGLEGDLRVGIEAQHRLVEHGEVGPAALPHPDRVAGRVRVVQLDGLPGCGTRRSRLDGSLN